MKSFPLSISFANRSVRQPVAWLIQGAAPAEWLQEICRWGVPLSEMALFPVPQSSADLRPRGVLVTVRGDVQPQVVPGAAPYGRVAGRLYLPVDAEIVPPVGDQELAALWPDSLVALVFHPAGGLSGFEAKDALPVSQLLDPPPRINGDWNRARPGTALNHRLWSVDPEIVPSVMLILEEGRGDIGTEADDIKSLPPLPDEETPTDSSQLRSRLASGAARAGIWLLNLFPGGASQKTWIDSLEKRLRDYLQSVSQRASLEAARLRELRRLMNLLESDPDRGLRFALPFGGGPHRGQGQASDQLVNRDPNFDLSRLSGGGPADVWDIPAQMRIDLLANYRKLAERELRLGRHRRAAYIFAELMDDLHAAAAALVAGLHFREAAVLYRERLQRPRDAARCLEQGSLWGEALRLYEEIEEYEKAADIAIKLDQSDDAARLYRSAVQGHVVRNDFLSAANILEQKLHEPDEALARLMEGWSTAQQGRRCLGETYRLLGRLGRRELALTISAGLRERLFIMSTFESLAPELVSVSRTYPHDNVRVLIADEVRVAIAGHLGNAGSANRQVLLDTLTGLAPEDRLLRRDCRRFGDNLRQRNMPSHRDTSKLSLRNEYQLPGNLKWISACTLDQWYFAAGYQGQELTVIQGRVGQPARHSTVSWTIDWQYRYLPVILLPDSQEILPLLVHIPRGPALEHRFFPANDWSPYLTAAGSPPWSTPEMVAMDRNSAGVASAISRSPGTLFWSSYNAQHVPVASQNIDLQMALGSFEGDWESLPVSLVVRDYSLYIGLANRLIVIRPKGSMDLVELPEIVRSIACSALHTRRRIAVTFDVGGQLIWDEGSLSRREWFGMSLTSPVVAFITGGWLVAASHTDCEIYSSNDQRLRLHARLQWPESSEPVSVMKTDVVNEFAVLFANGRFLTYRVPPAN